jgi:hypothetical protein
MTSSNSNPNDRQVGGEHYKSSYQHWDLMVDNQVPYIPAQVTKYTTRWKKKNGAQDVEKAIHYTEKLISLHRNMLSLPEPRPAIGIAKFIHENQLGNLEFLIFQILFTYTTTSELEAVSVLLEELRIQAIQAAPKS